MKVIVLSGQASSGKTMTLKMLIAMLLPGASDILYISKPNVTAHGLWEEIENDIANSPQDTHNLIAIMKFGEFVVGINTSGDVIGNAKTSIRIFKKYHCNMGICPCHPCTTAEGLLRQEYGGMMESWPKIKLPKEYSEKEKYLKNLLMATELYQEIMKQI